MVETISGGNEIRDFFAQVPIIAQRALNPYENALYQNYVQTGGTNGNSIRKTTKLLAEECHMSINKVKSSRLSLEAKGFITVKNMGHRKPLKVELCKIWDANTRFARAKTDAERDAILNEMKPKITVSSPDKTTKAIVSSPVETTKPNSSGPVVATNNNNYIITTTKELQPSCPPPILENKKDDSNPKKVRDAKIADFIKAWFDGQKTERADTGNPYGNKTNRKIMGALVDKGLSVNDITRYMQSKAKPNKFHSISWLNNDILGWLKTETPTATGVAHTGLIPESEKPVPKVDPLVDAEWEAMMEKYA